MMMRQHYITAIVLGIACSLMAWFLPHWLGEGVDSEGFLFYYCKVLMVGRYAFPIGTAIVVGIFGFLEWEVRKTKNERGD